MLRALKYRVRGLVFPVVFLGITYYFGWNAVHGKSGLEAQAAMRAQLAAAETHYDQVHEQRHEWETRVADLSSRSVSRDMLDGQARAVLNLADPNDLVIDISSGRSGQ